MRSDNAIKLDRKSGVRWGEHGAPVQRRGLRSLLQLRRCRGTAPGGIYLLIIVLLQPFYPT
jgi:hypothetical protein